MDFIRTEPGKPVSNQTPIGSFPMKLKSVCLLFASFLALAVFTIHPAAAAQLVMFTSDHCPWCAKWEKDIGVMYHLTDESKKAPLLRVDQSKTGKFKALERGVTFTPTFVLFDQNKEMGRITGYPGQDFFFPMLNNLLAKVPH